MRYIFLFKESLMFAINSLIVNKLRTFLSLLGITIGIFAIISVFAVIDSLEHNIRESISTLGNNVVYVQKWPWSFENNYPWWKYINRPVSQISDYEVINKISKHAENAAFIVATKKNVQYKDNIAEDITILAETPEYQNIRSFDISQGRYFSSFEAKNGRSIAVIGQSLSDDLFRGENPIGKSIKVFKRKVQIVGVFAKEGEDMLGMSTDNQVHISLSFARTVIDLKNKRLDPFIMVKAKEGISTDELIDELTGIMRASRRLPPAEENNFALNKSSLISKGLDGIFKSIDLAGIIIGGFSIIVGGFGIANIMFVSVKEQTKIIGIQKALGARRHFILLQFLYEAVILSLIGGLLGLILVFGITKFISSSGEMNVFLSFGNIATGVSISVVIGLLSGIIPAYQAAKLNPVDAISTT